MANLKDIKRRIGSVKNTRQITKAMKLVAAAKMRKAQENVMASRPYQQKLLQVIHSLGARVDDTSHPLLENRDTQNVLVIVFSSDKGLCGSFNANLFKTALNVIHENEGKGIYASVIGKKARDFFKRRNVMMEHAYLDYARDIHFDFATRIGREAMEAFTAGKVDKVYLVFNHFKSVLTQIPTVRQLLPLQPEIDETCDYMVDYLYEPSVEAILSDLLVKYVSVEVYQALLESWASENGARMAAMDSAARNAGDMISRLTLQYNRARQAAITTEIIEIVSGAQALEG